MKEGKPRHYHHHMEEATGEPVESYKVVCEGCQKVLGDVPDSFLRDLKFVMCGDCFGVGEPTVIEIGEPYPGELDPELHKANELAHEGMAALGRWLAHRKETDDGTWVRRWREMLAAYEEYEKMVAGDGGEE